MSEYIDIDAELSDDGRRISVWTNLSLAEPGRPESYESPLALESGSPVAQALAVIDGIAGVRIEESEMLIDLASDADWHAVVSDVSAALKDFFL